MPNQDPVSAAFSGTHITFAKARRRATTRPAGAVRGSIDVGIITMRPDEFGAMQRRLQPVGEAQGKTRVYNLATIGTEDGSVAQVALTRCLNQGPNEAQTAAEDLLQEIAPKWILLVGIAGGKPSDDFTLGDVVVSSRLVDFTVWAAQAKGAEFDAVGASLHPKAARLVTQLPAYLLQGLGGWNSRESIGQSAPTISTIPDEFSSSLTGPEHWRRRVAESLAHHFANQPLRAPLATIGPTASSGALVKRPSLFQAWLTHARSTLNVEMEFAGVFAAATRNDVPVLNIRGTSDIVGYKRHANWTSYACESAAALAVALLKSGQLTAQLSPEQLSFIDSYRTRMRSRFDIWDLGSAGITQVGGPSRPITAELDKMFLPLRLSQVGGASSLGSGATIGPDEVAGLARPLLIRGPAGSGKTTWSRWIFRRLVERPDVMPLLLTLRDLARRWVETNASGEQRSIDRYLSDSVSEHLGADIAPAAFDGFLRLHGEQAPPLVKLVLIVDGWDELGPLGVELRDKLNGFLQTYSHVSVVVTSRPYGTAPPTGSAGFDTRDISPLSASDINYFAARFFEQCYGEERAQALAESERFWHALSSSPSALSLASTVLILTMMLLISRTRPLPDKRHRLYQDCIENLLTALPTRRAQGGALLDDVYWCPIDSDERMRAVAHLAFSMHAKVAGSETASAIFSTADELDQMLPKSWPSLNRRRFLAWLVGPSGVLTDRSDGAMAFAHLSFQEYLAAWHLNATVEGARERNDVYGTYLPSPTWWEALLLWAAILASQSPDRLRPVLRHLESLGPEGIALAGLMMADGLASDLDFQDWLDVALGDRGDGSVVRSLQRYAGSWRNSRQDARRQQLSIALGNRGKGLPWADWFRLAELLDGLGTSGSPTGAPAWPSNQLDREIVLRVVQGKGRALPSGVAVGRVLVQATATHPMQPDSVSMLLLSLWPSHRVVLGQRLQLAAICGAGEQDLRDLGRSLAKSVALSPSERREATINLARSIPADRADPEWVRDFVNSLPGDLARSHLVALANTRRAFKVEDFKQYATGGIPPTMLGRAEAWALSLSKSAGVDPENAWLRSFAYFDLCLAAPCLRWALASGLTPLPSGLSVIRDACRRSLMPSKPISELAPVKPLGEGKWGPPAVWEAMFRVVGGGLSAEDQSLLEEFARTPSKEFGIDSQVPFVVRGDVLLREGGTLTLDEICDSASEPRIPLVQPAATAFHFEMYFPTF